MLPCRGAVAERTVRSALLGLLLFPAQPRKSASDHGPVAIHNQDRPPELRFPASGWQEDGHDPFSA
jgi:hypothetical protein